MGPACERDVLWRAEELSISRAWTLQAFEPRAGASSLSLRSRVLGWRQRGSTYVGDISARAVGRGRHTSPDSPTCHIPCFPGITGAAWRPGSHCRFPIARRVECWLLDRTPKRGPPHMLVRVTLRLEETAHGPLVLGTAISPVVGALLGVTSWCGASRILKRASAPPPLSLARFRPTLPLTALQFDRHSSA